LLKLQSRQKINVDTGRENLKEKSMSHRTVIVLPDDTGKPIHDAIRAAKTSLRIKMFVFSDPDLIKAVIAAKGRGAKVQVMLNPARRSGKEENTDTRKELEGAGVEVKDSNPDFGITHEKSMVVDGELAFVQSLNWKTENLTQARDYAIVSSHKHEVDEVVAGFEADWHRTDFDPGEHAHLIWCRGNGRARIARRLGFLLNDDCQQIAYAAGFLVREKPDGKRAPILRRFAVRASTKNRDRDDANIQKSSVHTFLLE
jgi:hypothetical protein